MGTFIKKIVYNQAFIDQTSRRKGDERNREFWQKMRNLHSSYPDCDIPFWCGYAADRIGQQQRNELVRICVVDHLDCHFSLQCG